MIDYRQGFRWNLGLNLITKIATPLIAILVARNLGPSVMGAYAIVTTILIFSDIFRDSVLVRVYLRESEIDEATDRSYAALSVAVHIALALGVASLGIPFASAFRTPELVWALPIAAVAVALNGLSALPHTKLLRQGDFKRAALAETLGSVLSSAYALTLVLAGAGLLALVTQLIVRSVIFLAFTYRWAPCRIGRGAAGLFRRIAGTSSELTLTNLLWVGFSFGDQLLISRLLGVAVGGYYATGKMMVQSADFLAKPLMQTATVAFADRKQDPEAVRKTLSKSLLAFLLVVAPIYAVVAIFAQPLVLGVLSDKFAGTVAIVPPLCLYFASIYPGSFAADSLVMAGKARVPLFGWLAGYAYLAVVLSVFWASASLATLAWILASGLVLVNLNSLAHALKIHPPSQQAIRAAAKATLALVATSGTAAALNTIPAPQWTKIALASLLPAVHLAFVGLAFYRAPGSLFKPARARLLWQSL